MPLGEINTRLVDPAKIPASLKQPCRTVTNVPDRVDLMAAAELWPKDRDSLGDCGRRHRALVRSIEAVEGQAR